VVIVEQKRGGHNVRPPVKLLTLLERPLFRFEGPDQPTAVTVAKILRVYLPDAVTAVDLTPGRGNFWHKDLPIRVSVERSPYDFRDLPYLDQSRDVVLFDPPHIADGGKRSVMAARYGTYRASQLPDVIRQGTREAWRVSRLGIVVKVTDHVHSQRFIMQSEWVRAALEDVPLCAEIYQFRSHPFIDSKWKKQYSARSNGSTFLIFKHGPPHERPRSQSGQKVATAHVNCRRFADDAGSRS
jgi:hypothetical protein